VADAVATDLNPVFDPNDIFERDRDDNFAALVGHFDPVIEGHAPPDPNFLSDQLLRP
jgi:hypothetical protein